MKHILTLLSLIFFILAVYNLAQPLRELSAVTIILGIVGGTYLIVQMLRGKLKGGSA